MNKFIDSIEVPKLSMQNSGKPILSLQEENNQNRF